MKVLIMKKSYYCKKGRHNKPRLQPRPFRPLLFFFLLTVCMCCALMDRNKYIYYYYYLLPASSH